MCYQCKVSLAAGWTPCNNASASSLRHHRHGDTDDKHDVRHHCGASEDKHDDINVVFDMKCMAALSTVSSSDVWVIVTFTL